MVLLILLVLALFVVQTLLPGRFREPAPDGRNDKLTENLGNRDHVRPFTVVGGRAERALANMHEALPVFLALALLNMMKSRSVHDYFRRDGGKHRLDRIRRLHIHLGMGQSMDGIAVALKFLADVSANLPFCSDHSDHHPHLRLRLKLQPPAPGRQLPRF